MMQLSMPKKKPSKTKFGEQLSQIRTKRGMTQMNLANAIASTQRAISAYETGTSYPPIPVIADLAAALKISVDELMGLKETKHQKTQDPNTNRLWKRFQKILQLPEKDQRAIIRMVNSLAETQKFKQQAA